jgi:DNA invertase Pin-like site-specific DNA recombinase
MGRDPTELTTPDLFSTDEVRDASAAPKDQSAATPPPDTSSERHILPKNLRNAVKQLSDRELDELIEVAFDEGERRGRLPGNIGSLPRRPTRQVNVAEVPLTRGQLNAVRSAFKAGITPSRIARQFGISQSNVRKALASDESKR